MDAHHGGTIAMHRGLRIHGLGFRVSSFRSRANVFSARAHARAGMGGAWKDLEDPCHSS